MSHILIVDDDELIAELARDAMFCAGHTSTWVQTAETAWENLKRQRSDLVLLDQHMPGMTGVSLLRQLRSSPDFYDLPVIMLTAMTGAVDEDRALFAGANDYVRKPFTQNGLANAVDRLLMKRGAQSHMDLKSRVAQDSGQSGFEPAKVRRLI